MLKPERLRISTTVGERVGGRKDLMYPVDPTTKAVAEEVVVNVQGYAVRTNLPPITRRDRYDAVIHGDCHLTKKKVYRRTR